MKDLFTIVVAAGRGSRVGAKINKAFLDIAGLPLLVRTLKSLNACQVCKEVAVVVAPSELEQAKQLLADYREHFMQLRYKLVAGGKERQDSVRNGLAAVPEEYSLIAVHDGARPFIKPAVFEKVYATAKETGAAIAAVTASDTVKLIRNGLVEVTADRSRVVLVQTPQIFLRKVLEAAYEKAAEEGFTGTDDASLVENYGFRVTVVESDKQNIKITTPEDVVWAEMKCEDERMDFRVGTGFDVHRFTEGNALTIGGVEIPYERSLLGHSDADVLLHAVADALLGAAALGDIGKFFPDTDPQYKGADSKVLLEQVVELLQKNNWRINNIDATIMAQQPKMAPHIEAMQSTIAKICQVEETAVGVKATTTEKLGFVGRQEGIAAQAVATIKKA